jgi:hypothetical protein
LALRNGMEPFEKSARWSWEPLRGSGRRGRRPSQLRNGSSAHGFAFSIRNPQVQGVATPPSQHRNLSWIDDFIGTGGVV